MCSVLYADRRTICMRAGGAITLSALKRGCTAAQEGLHKQLQTRGFGFVRNPCGFGHGSYIRVGPSSAHHNLCVRFRV
jgi:hypothetical protein